MAEFPPNLDDGELWIPSDILPKEVPYGAEINPHYLLSHRHNQISDVEDLARRFALMASLDRSSKATPKHLVPSPFQRFGPAAVPNASTALPASAYYGVAMKPEVEQGLYAGHGTGSVFANPDPNLQSYLGKPLMSQAEEWMDSRILARQLQAQRNHLQNRFLPFQGGGIKFGGGSARDCGGTGVFLPRTAATTATRKTINEDCARRRQERRERPDAQIEPPGDAMRRVVVGKREECHRQLPPDLGLPRDWTY
ncbi:hypothetical protein Nepgr_030549 [Nepenthes gracilis]|uniref:Uncharacterized protein n=1 Tax=Nepenthes gracilis TaxID=150966 RepID=A0AAD3TGE9_NEPGR|nr:hypothetical protein Nepgr_030549 [Nepenthes gracilis]